MVVRGMSNGVFCVCFLFPTFRHSMGCMVTSFGNKSGIFFHAAVSLFAKKRQLEHFPILPKPCAHVWPLFLFVLVISLCSVTHVEEHACHSRHCIRPFHTTVNNLVCSCGHDTPLFPTCFSFSYCTKLQPTLGTLQLSPCIRQRAHTVLNAIKQWHLSLTSFQAPHHQKWEASHGSRLSLSLSLSSSSATSFAQQRPRASYAKWCSSPILFPNLKWWYQSTWAPRLCLCVISIFNKSNSLTSLTWHLTNDWINMHHRNTMNQLHGSMTFLLSQLGSGWWG